MKRIQVLVAIAFFAGLAACTTNQSALLPPLPEVEAHVISGAAPIEPSREVASTASDNKLDGEFETVMSSSDVDRAARKQIDRIARIFYRTQALLNDYDAKIDELAKETNPREGALLTDDTYARLISAWALREESLERLTYFYKRALEITPGNGSKASREREDHALVFKRAIRNGVLSASNSTNRLAKQELLRELINVHTEHRAARAKFKDQTTADEVSKVSAALSKQIIESPEEMKAFYAANKSQLSREAEASKKDDELNKEIEAQVPDVKRSLNEQFEKRTPQSVGAIAPGLGRTGMLNGFEFPKGTWALTYDDGPHSTYTPQALANLKAAGMKASFFWIAKNVGAMHSIVKQAQDADMTVANHSFTHANLPKLGPAGLRHEIIELTTVDVQAGYRPRFFRCPYGACGSQTSAIRQKIADLKMISVTWNVDSLDWQDKNPQSVYDRVKKQMAAQGRGIILFHDIHPQSIAATKILMADFAAGQKKGIYRTVTIDQAFDELNSPEGMK